jgi:hypothetical protein
VWPITAAVTAVEAHIGRLIDTLVKASGTLSTTLGHALVQTYKSDMTRSWPARFEWLSRGFGVSVQGTSLAQDMCTVNELRNAIVHGNMNLTDVQCRNLQDMINLRRSLSRVLGVHCVGRKVVVGHATTKLAIKVCIDFVQFLDHAVITKYPSLIGDQ